MTREELIEGLKLLEDNMVYFDELLNDKGKWIDVHELLFETIKELEQCEVWDGIHGQVIAPKGTFDKIWEEAEKEEQEPKTGHWVKKSQYGNDYCSECGYELLMYGKTKYCPNCGAKMESEG